jgi:4-amino-4-deoxy-L-arabinose transferase-like glycosyltransferase
MLIDPSPGQSFYALTYPEPHWLGDRATVVVKPQFREMDYWKAGWQNLQSHPHKAWQNWRANVNRMVFDFPYSFSTGQPAAVGTGNGAFGMAGLFLLYALCVMAFWQARHSLPAELRLLLAWTLAGLGVRSLLSAGAEAVLPWIPSLVLTIYLTLSHILKIKIRRQDLAPPVAMG